MNQMKGRVFNLDAEPQDREIFTGNLETSVEDGIGEDAVLQPLRQV